jgi:phosphonate transport system substrate-binding protein
MSIRALSLLLLPFVLLVLVGVYLMPRGHQFPESGTDLRKPADPQTLFLGFIESDPDRLRPKVAPLVAYLNSRLALDSILIAPVYARDLQELYVLYDRGEIDFFIETPFSIFRMVRQRDMKVIARRWKSSTAEYHTVFLTRTNSPIESLADLVGGDIAFEDPDSTSSWFLPASELRTAGFSLIEGRAEDFPNLTTPAVFYEFSGWDRYSVQWLLAGKSDAAAVSSLFYESELTPGEKTQLRVLHNTATIPRSLLAARKDLDNALIDPVLQVLFNMETSSQGKAALRRFEDTHRFDPVPYETELRERFIPLLESFNW